MKKKLIVLFSVLFFVIAIFVVGMFFFYVFQFKDYNEKPLQISSFSDEIQDENFAAIPTDNVKTYLISPTDNIYPKLIDILNSTNYTCCFHTISSNWFPEKESNKLIRLSWDKHSIYLSDNSSHIVMDGTVYHITSSTLYEACCDIVDMIHKKEY